MMAVTDFCLLLWSIYKVATIELPTAKLNSTSIDESKDELKQIKYWFGIALVEFVIEIALCFAIYFVRSKVTPCRNPDRTLESRIASENLEYEMISHSTDDLEMPKRMEEIPTVSEPVVEEAVLSTAYDPTRINTIRERIRQADEGMNFFLWRWKPFP